MKNRVIFFVLLVGVLLTARASVSGTSSTPPAIQSVTIWAPPMIHGGYAFYADAEGRVIYQSVEPDATKGHGYIKKRFAFRDTGSIFADLIAGIEPNAMLGYQEGRKSGIPDELRLRFDLTYFGGAKIVAHKWDSDRVDVLDRLVERMRTAIQIVTKSTKPATSLFDWKKFEDDFLPKKTSE